MGAVDGVVNVHDLHVWSLGSNSSALACHVTIADIPPSESACILARLNYVLKERFHISHATIQFEHMGCEELEGCVVPMEEMASGKPQPPRPRALIHLTARAEAYLWARLRPMRFTYYRVIGTIYFSRF